MLEERRSMFLRDVVMSCVRRWYFLLAGLLIATAGTLAVAAAVPPSYEAKSSVVLIPPKSVIVTGDNPYMYMGGLEQALGVLQTKLSSPDVTVPLIKDLPGAQLTIARDVTTTGPILVVTASADDPASAMRLLSNAGAALPATLSSLQTQMKVPEGSLITSLQLSADSKPSVVNKKQLQYVGLAAAVGVVAALLIVGLLDRWLISRRGKRTAPDAVATSGDALPVGHALDPVAGVESQPFGPPRRGARRGGEERGSRLAKSSPQPSGRRASHLEERSSPEPEDVSA